MTQATLFEKIYRGEIPAKFLYRDEVCFAIADIDPKAPFHALVIPVKPLVSLASVTADDVEIVGTCLRVAAQLAQEHGLAAGWRLVSNVGDNGGQSVPHLHFHVLGGRRLTWPPG